MDGLHGFHTELQNGVTVSVQWDEGHLSQIDKTGTPISVEMACWIKVPAKGGYNATKNVWMTKIIWPYREHYGDDVLGYIPVADVIKLIDIAAEKSQSILLGRIEAILDLKQGKLKL